VSKTNTLCRVSICRMSFCLMSCRRVSWHRFFLSDFYSLPIYPLVCVSLFLFPSLPLSPPPHSLSALLSAALSLSLSLYQISKSTCQFKSSSSIRSSTPIYFTGVIFASNHQNQNTRQNQNQNI